MDRQLIDYLPPVLRDVREYAHVTAAEQPEVDALWSEAARAVDNATVLTADEYGVARWERMLGITPPATRTLEDRRAAVLSAIFPPLPFTLRRLQQKLAPLGGAARVSHLSYHLDADFEANRPHNIDALVALLRGMLPANLTCQIIITSHVCVAFSATAASHRFEYEIAGTSPDTNTLGVLHGRAFGLATSMEGHLYLHTFSGVSSAGEEPEINTVGSVASRGISPDLDAINAAFPYHLCGESEREV